MRNGILLLSIVSLFVGCIKLDPIIKKFEKHLPKSDLSVLKEWVNFYEKLVHENFAGDQRKLLQDIVDNNFSSWKYDKEKLCQLIEKYQNSTLEFKTEKLKYDSTQESEDIVIFGKGQTIESIKEQGYWKPISKSSFVNAIENLKTKDKELKEYIETKRNDPFLNWQYMAKYIIDSKEIKIVDYFIKRIIIFEIFIKYMEKEQKC